MTQSIIVYRNPMEQAFWESGLLLPLVAGSLAGFISFLLIYASIEWILKQFVAGRNILYNNRKGVQILVRVVGVIATAIGISTMLYLA